MLRRELLPWQPNFVYIIVKIVEQNIPLQAFQMGRFGNKMECFKDMFNELYTKGWYKKFFLILFYLKLLIFPLISSIENYKVPQ